MSIGQSELILNADGSVYHLNLLPEDIAPTVIVVGDPDRVEKVSGYFDHIDTKKQKREFLTHTGTYKGKRITVIGTGIGTDNIDIVLNELDALVNIDLPSRGIKEEKTSLDIIRIGTSGSIQDDIPVDTFVVSKFAIGFDGLLHFYEHEGEDISALTSHLKKYMGWGNHYIQPYSFASDAQLLKKMSSNRIRFGITLTNSGFYGPQGRKLRLSNTLETIHDSLANFEFENAKITNLEMETAAIYGLAKLLGHRAISLNAILANRPSKSFSKHPAKTVDTLIRYCLERLS
ncbi:MAG: nucleoside phosphorylase [Bacteroidota bacterium]